MTIPLDDGGAKTAERVMSVFIGLAGLAGGLVLFGVLMIASFIFSFGSPPSRGDVTFAAGLGGFIAAVGVALAIMTWINAGRPSRVVVGGDALEIAYRPFAAPLAVTRAQVRVVAIDDQPMRPFRNNPRFPIEGALPEDVFADALDNAPLPPWEDLDPERHARRRLSPAAVWGRLHRRPDHDGSRGYSHDDPSSPGWASGGPGSALPVAARRSYLWSSAGSSLPFLRIGPADVPNLAIIFNDTLATPRASWWFWLLPLNNRCAPGFRGGRAVRGLLMKVKDPRGAEAAFGRWGVVRPITSEDVLAEGLLVAKPLVGVRAAIYAVSMAGLIIVQLLLRHLR